MIATIDHALLEKIDGLALSQRNQSWRAAMKAAGWQVYADREKWTVQSWRETAGQDIQLRRAKLLACVLDNLEIKIHPFDEIVGRPTPGVIGCATAIDVCGDYIPDIWRDDGAIRATLDASAVLDPADKEILRESARLFGPAAFPKMASAAWEALVGDWAKQAEAAKLKDPGLDSGITGQSTSTLNWPKLLRVGLRGYLEEARARKADYLAHQGRDVNKVYFWDSAVIVLEAVIRHARRYGDLADSMAARAEDPAEQARLREIAAVCRYVPENPPRSFHEALQAMQLCNLAKMLENPCQNNAHWGRADQYLYPFFQADLEKGVPLEKLASLLADLIGRWGTQTYVSNSTQKESHQVNFGINNVMLGGLNARNEDCCNELSYLFLHLVGKLCLSSPTVGLRWNRHTPDWMMRKAIRTNLETKGGIPLFESDEAIIGSYVRDGIPFAEAVEWGGLGCVYPCIPTRAEHYGAEGVAAVNLAGVLHLTLHNGLDIHGAQTGPQTGDPRDFTSFEALYGAFLTQHRALSHRVMWLGGVARDTEGQYFRTPLLSVLGIEASMTLGQDLLNAHPDYSLFGISDRAIVDAADSLTAIDRLVFQSKTLTMAALLEALDSDFSGPEGEALRQLCLRQPKYGNDDPEADEMVRRVSRDSAAIIRDYDNAPFRPYMISREGLAWHYFGGLGVGALPNGRKALEPLNDGSLSPMRGADKSGPTAVIRSACSAGFGEVCYAAVLNQKFTSALLGSEESVEKLIAYTNAYMKAGGSHIQYNILDSAQLRDAQQHPADYGDLIVRIGGFSAYFTQLSEAIQDDVIYRSEFQL